MRRIVFPSVSVVLLALLLVFSAFITNTAVRPCKEHYENKALNFSIDYPSGWFTEEDTAHATVSFVSPEKDSLGEPTASFYVHFPEWANGMKEKDFEETLINSYYNEYNQIRISYQQKDDPDKKSWGMIELFVQKGIYPIKYIRTYYNYSPEGCIIISYQTRAKQADKFKDVIESSIKSFKSKRSDS